MKSKLLIGVVGYCPPTKFDIHLANKMINEAYDIIEKKFPETPKMVVSGLTNVGVLKIAYEQAILRKWSTKGVACSLANNYPLFPVDEQIIIGDNWGDESEEFLLNLDCMIRIGMGDQSIRECNIIREKGLPTFEYNLPAL
ncbi:hypothetical protein FHS04_000780 [Mesoflavibacter sabulilitoris]|uniref:Uncharacterized protein n=1 Tax=Mesoflavibacter zeaxanthinifaciens subsp. sabulilitoris TaxID=1520893 RepID=A0A2T1N6I0_9FLAO|nr:hypothetical protein [Mesoflavibacter zeaxanthinifaciens]MBB3123283.1 hypothetical protein [Mesoflavibacter zeaxanthinifaciens subsp. sabulilitoris]PSG87080.1 hypothetical protein C7H61_13295 [Mesoflavibacter zeaxanthinifaciens subsp. sabulilitoris]